MTLVLAKITKHRMIITIIAAMTMMMMFVPSTVTQAANDPFGVGYGTSVGLGSRDVRDTIGEIIRVALSLLGIVALVIVLTGGFKWMTAGGAEDKVAEARKLIFSGIIGMAIILSAFAISRFVLGQLSIATGVTGGGVPGFN
jgi:hypothetical protein